MNSVILHYWRKAAYGALGAIGILLILAPGVSHAQFESPSDNPVTAFPLPTSSIQQPVGGESAVKNQLPYPYADQSLSPGIVAVLYIAASFFAVAGLILIAIGSASHRSRKNPAAAK